MVFIDLCKILEATKKEIVKRFEEININSHPVDFAWLLYALQREKETPLFNENFEKLKRWSFTDISDRIDRNIGALALCLYFSRELNETDYIELIRKVETVLERNLNNYKLTFRHNVLYDSSEMFMVSLISDYLDERLKKKLQKIAYENIAGSIPRKILFLVSSINFGVKWEKVRKIARDVLTDLKGSEDIIVALWLCENFNELNENIPSLLTKLYKIFSMLEKCDRISIPTQYLSLLYHTINKELAYPHPLTFFSLYPFEQELREICKEYFKYEDYSTAISEALKKLIDLLKKKARESNVSHDKIKELEARERNLIRELLNPKIPQNFKKQEPPIKFIELKTCSEESFQEGLALLLEGAWIAFRHPEAHQPKDHITRKIVPYDAIAILTLINYLWRRIKNVKN